MSHNLEIVNGSARMFYVQEVPWHGLGERLEAPPTAEEAIKAAGMDWKVVKVPVFARVPTPGVEGPEEIETEDYRAIVREGDRKILGIVGKEYEPLQNSAAFEFMDPLIKTGEATFETAGVLDGGKVVWVMVKLKESFAPVAGDEMQQHLLITNAHDGSRVVQNRYTNVRVVCDNTLVAATHGGQWDDRTNRIEGVMRIRHTRNVEQAVKEASRVIDRAHRMGEQMKSLYQEMTTIRVTEKELVEMNLVLIPDNERATSNVRTQNQRLILRELLESGRGTEIPGVRGTLYGWLQAAIEYADHVKGVPVGLGADRMLPSEKKLTRLKSNWYGDTAAFKGRAMKIVKARLEMTETGAAVVDSMATSQVMNSMQEQLDAKLDEGEMTA